jgi:ATP-dependent DNA helicase RecQ
MSLWNTLLAEDQLPAPLTSTPPSYGGGVTKASRASIEKLARERLGFKQLRPGQLSAVSSLTAGRDVLAVLPTGAGKSAIYELAGLLRAGPVIVVSPLIALQDDQLAHLRAAGLQAVVLNSQQSAGARAASLLASCESGTFVFLAPEQLANPEARAALERARPGLFAVDEAHLISQWGRDFRPDYMRLGAAAEAVGAPVRLALTATAAPPVRQEIVRRFGLCDPEVVIGDFDRPNIELSAHRALTADDKHDELVRIAAAAGGAGIVYAATHASAQAAHDVLAAAGERVALYHAGLSAGARRDAMAAFMDGSARIIAATVAFGMGIDKPDVRWVTHLDPPASLDAYYQELGRAGRDGDPSHARLLYRYEDFGKARYLTARGVSDAAVGKAAAALAAGELASGELAEPAGRQQIAALVRLADLGAASWQPDGEVRWTGALTVADVLEASDAQTERENEIERTRLAMMRHYAEHDGCRRSFLLSYFGQDFPGPCGNCDNDREQPPGRPAPVPADVPFAVGARVVSERWGEGTVQRYDGDQVTVLFDEHGYRELYLPVVSERGLLRPG